ncbi:MAG TPA: DUF2877 domain-containing protein, partial [Micromonosporaceae bacterium]
MARPYPVAASTAVEPPLVGPPRPATVVCATPTAVYLRILRGQHDEPGGVICLATPDAVQVPCALIVAGKPARALPVQGATGTVGAGLVRVGDTAFRVRDWWRPPQPRGLGTTPPARLADTVRWLTTSVADPLDDAGRDAVAGLITALSMGTPADEPVSRLLGRGTGLTPTGDDVLAATLVSLIAFGSPAARQLAQAVTATADRATNPVSAALLRHAARGRCIPQLADLLTVIADH